MLTQRILHLVIGLAGFYGICWLLSKNRRAIRWRLVAMGLTLQIGIALLILKTEPGKWVFSKLNAAVVVLLGFTKQGTAFLLRSFKTGVVETSLINVAFDVLPTIIFFSSLMTILYYLGVMQFIVGAVARVMQKTFRTSGAETMSVAASIFVGQTEAPLVIKPFVKDMTQSELMTIMTAGFAHVAGGVLAAYVGMLSGVFPGIGGHLIAASVMAAPGSIVISKILVPETETPRTAGTVRVAFVREQVNIIDAAAKGALDGVTLVLNVAGVLLAFVALIAMLNFIVGSVGGLIGVPQLSLQVVLGYVFWPISWLMGVEPKDCLNVGMLLGTKTVVNEFLAYVNLSELLKGDNTLAPHSALVATYALCGFANFGSIAIQIGGIGGLAPERRSDLARLGLRAMIAGSIASFTTATIAGALA